MSLATMYSRNLEMTPAQKGLTSGLSIAAALLLILAGLWCLRRNKRTVQEEEAEKEVEIQEETSQESMIEDIEVALTESKSSESEDTYDKSISMCRSNTMNSLDVHTCASGSCDLCRKNQEPNFLGVKKVAPGTEGKIRSLPDKWWENPLGLSNRRPEALQTIVSMSKSEGSEWTEGVGSMDESRDVYNEDEGLQMESGVVRD